MASHFAHRLRTALVCVPSRIVIGLVALGFIGMGARRAEMQTTADTITVSVDVSTVGPKIPAALSTLPRASLA